MPKVGQRSALRSRLLRVFAGFDACDLPESAPAIGSQTFMRLPATPTRATSVDAPFRARGNFRTVVARGRMLPSVRPLVRQRTAAGLYGSSRTGSRSQPRTRGTVLHTGYPDPVSPTVAPCRPSARPTPSRPRRAYAAGAGAR